MCGRYVLALRPSEVRSLLASRGLDVQNAPADDATRPSYNIAPSTNEPIYRATTSSDGKVSYNLEVMKWGLVPNWSSTMDSGFAGTLKTINCRDDSLIENRGLWNSVKHTKRCVVIAQGFYEWLKKGNDKLPHYIHPEDGSLFLFAGLYDISKDGVPTFSIVTTSSNPKLRFLHERMPVILRDAEAVKKWLNPEIKRWCPELQKMLVPWEGEGVEVYQVAKEVGKVGKSESWYIQKLSERKGNIEGFFGKKRERTEDPVAEAEGKETKRTEMDDTREQTEETLKLNPDEGDTKDTSGVGSTSGMKSPLSSLQKFRSPISNSANRGMPSPRKKKSAIGPQDGNRKITSFFKK